MVNVRQPHAPLDVTSRQHKGLKIERLLELRLRTQPLRILEVGTGSGGISHYFATHAELTCMVDSVDVCDLRVVTEGYNFQLVKGTELPFRDQSFDVVISNHVIEHVGDTAEQLGHLKEVHRVLDREGIGYIALPNRWMLIEPHYRIAFLSWLPERLRSPYLRLRRRGDFYDCKPLELGQLEALLKQAGLRGKNLCPSAIVETLAIEMPDSWWEFIIRKVPLDILAIFNPVNPTLVYSVKRMAEFGLGKETVQ